jgi:putative peptidoglycan lipid II flippase
LIKIESYKKGALLSIIFNGLAKGILFLLTIIIARYFGNNIKTDIYFFIYSTMILFSGFINAVDISVLVPESMRIRAKDGEAAAMSFLNYFLRIYLFIGIAFVVAMYFFGTTIFGLISKFSEADIYLYRNYFLIGAFYFLFQVITSYINNILTSLKFFTIPMIISGINSCIIIAGIILLHNQFDVLSVLISGVAAYAVNCVILFIVLKRAAQLNFYTGTKKIKQKVWSNILFTELGQFATTAASYFPLYLLSGFGSGIISSMNYGKNIADIPNTLVTSQLSTVSGIKLNEQIARHDVAGMNDTFLRTGKLMLFILVPVGFFLFVFAQPIAAFFYKRPGFSETDLVDTAMFLRLLSVTVFSIAVNSLVSRLFIAVQAIKQAFIYQVAMSILLIFLIWIFTHSYGAYGYGYATITLNIINYLLMYFICKALVKEINYAALLKHTAVIILINSAITAAFFFIEPQLPFSPLVKLAFCFVLWLGLLLLFNKIFRLNSDLSFITQKENKNAL